MGVWVWMWGLSVGVGTHVGLDGFGEFILLDRSGWVTRLGRARQDERLDRSFSAKLRTGDLKQERGGAFSRREW